MRIVLVRLLCLAFLAARIPRVASLNAKQTSLVEKSGVFAQDAELVVISYRDQVHTLLTRYEQDRTAILDNIHQVTKDLLAKWKLENEELAKICEAEAAKPSSSSISCGDRAAILESQRRDEIAMVAIDLPQQKTDAMHNYLSEFILLEMLRMQDKSKLEQDLNSVKQILLESGRRTRRKIEPYVNEDMNRIELSIDELEAIGTNLQITIEDLNTIVFGNVCFEFVGVTNSIEEVGSEEYNDAMKKSLEFAFIEQKVDMEVLGFEFLAENVSYESPKRQRTLTRVNGYGVENIEERALKRTQVTKSANMVGVRCRCSTGQPVSDVPFRRTLAETGTDVFSTEVMTTVATVLREELPENFANLEYVSTFHCSEFEFQSTMTKLASVGPYEASPFFLRLPGHSCKTFQAKNLGTEFQTPEECGDAAILDPACSGNEIMWSEYSGSWGCRCCFPNPNPGGDEAYKVNQNWNMYQYKELESAVSTDFKLRLPGYSCSDFAAKSLGLDFQTARECADAAVLDPICSGSEVMWSAVSLGCTCCLENPIPGEIDAYNLDQRWSIFQYKEPEVRTDFSLRLPGHSCSNFEAKNLGTSFLNAEQCADAARDDPACTGNEIMWSKYSYSWGCRCCLPNPGQEDEEYKLNGNWNIYRFS